MSDPKVRHSSSGSSDSESSTDSYESGSCSSGSKGKADYGSLLNQYLANKSNSKDGQNIVETDTELHNIIQRSETIINAGNNRIKRESKQEVNRLNTLDKETNFKVEPVGSNRIKVTVSTDLEPARVFECDRFCPHKGADLLEATVRDSNMLICPKHKWSFKLEDGGRCTRNETTINCNLLEF